MKIYEAPELFVDEYVADTMIASSGELPGVKNGNADNNQNCWGCDQYAYDTQGNNMCVIIPDEYGTYDMFCK